MRRPTIAIVGLSIALAVSNLWWLYTAIDNAVTDSYRQSELDEYQQMFKELSVVAPAAARRDASRESVLSAARATAETDIEFEKDGFVWVGRLGYRFNEVGTLVEVSTGWDLP